MRARKTTVYEFKDLTDSLVTVEVYHGIVALRCADDPIELTLDNVRELLPLLQHFAETGELPEPGAKS